jgi:hypothetical protein
VKGNAQGDVGIGIPNKGKFSPVKILSKKTLFLKKVRKMA